jgi:hypothetical protein
MDAMTQAPASSAFAAPPISATPAVRRHAPRYGLGFALFVLVNATLFIRPSEIFGGADWSVYEFLIVPCLIASLPAVLKQLQWKSLQLNPGVLAVLGLLPAVLLSHLSHGDIYRARTDAVSFMKTQAYFILLVSLVNTVPRLRRFLALTAVFIVATAGLAVLSYHGVFQLNSEKTLNRADQVDPDTGDVLYIDQLEASGLFSDPNDFSLILVTGLMATTYFAMEKKALHRRAIWLAFLPLLLYALFLTKSRGGFLSFLGASGVFVICRLGWKRGLIAGVFMLPLALALFAGRATNIDIGNQNDTAMGRILLWRDGLAFFRANPAFGIGMGLYGEQADQVAHNSYVHSYAELGFLGGTFFLLAWLSPIFSCRKSQMSPTASPLAFRLQPCVLAIVVGYAVGLFSLSRDYVAPTYLSIGVGCAFCALTCARGEKSWAVVNRRLVFKTVLASVLMIGFLYAFVRVMTA